MGADRKAPPLPAPTETESTTGDTEFSSRITEKSSYILPEDGSPVTIATRRKNSEKDGHDLNTNKSQTSLLIEYFEGGKGSQTESRRPSVRVKVTPSSKNRSKASNDHIQITERKGTRKPSYTKRIQLPPNVRGDGSPEGDGDDHSLHSYRSATEESNVTSRGGGPIEVEIIPRRHGSPLIPTESTLRTLPVNPSEISSMPEDSFLDGKIRSLQQKGSRTLSRGDGLAADATTALVAGVVADGLRTPSRRRSRSLSRERIVVQKALEKVRSEKSEQRRRKHSSRSRSVSSELVTEPIKSPKRGSSRSHNEDSLISGADSSLLHSHLSGKSGDAYSFRSATSKSSINNPKLLETVEDAIRRLILPELTALKREQSKYSQRERDRRGSFNSGSGISKDSRDSRDNSSGTKRTDCGSSTDVSRKPRVILNDSEVISEATPRESKGKRVDCSKAESPHSYERETSVETVTQDGERIQQNTSSDMHEDPDLTVSVGDFGPFTSVPMKNYPRQSLVAEKKERQRPRTKSRSQSDSIIETFQERELQASPPMPLTSEINASEITRSSILSAETERPHSASQEGLTQVHEIPRGIASAPRTPTRTPVQLQQRQGTQRTNYSRRNLTLHSQSSESQTRSLDHEWDEVGRKFPVDESPHSVDSESNVEPGISGENDHVLAAGLASATGSAGLSGLYNRCKDLEFPHEPHNICQSTQEVPPPLRYVPYAQERRALSPIQSVSGWTEGEPDNQGDSRLTHSSGSYCSIGLSARQKKSGRSMKSLESSGHVRQNPHDFPVVREGGLTDSEITQDAEYWEEQHHENDRNRAFDEESYRSSGIDYKHMTNYTDDSMDGENLDRIATGQNVHGLGANPNYVHIPVGIESAVASLVNESELTGGSGYSGIKSQFDRRTSYASFEEGSERQFTARSPKKIADTDLGKDHGEDSNTGSQKNSPSRYEEYDVDESGRKVPMLHYALATEKALAAGAAAAVLTSRNRHSAADEIKYEDRHETSGAPLQKSFKDRAMAIPGQLPSPRHSIGALSETSSRDNIKMSASGIPDMNDPMPEIGFGDGDSGVLTNPSIINGPIGDTPQQGSEKWVEKATSPRQNFQETTPSRDLRSDLNVKTAEGALSEDEWRRDSSERKRDTLITNPYENTSPVAAADALDRDLTNFQDVKNTYIPTKLSFPGEPINSPKDEGYISSAPNNRSPDAATPEPRMKYGDLMDQGVANDLIGDPFYTPKHQRHLSGMSHGMGSPIYDSATGSGIDRIQSKDIVALMDHLTVRDAQRSARDTEILVTLVRAAAEMRNSFEDMKRLLADTEDVIITEVQANTEKSVQKVINGPRPLPQSGARSVRQGSQDDIFEDIPTKKRNVFRRALKGLSMKSANDLGKIEEMLVQLLGEVEGLKVVQGLKPHSNRAESYDLLNQDINEHDRDGYEPEGNAGTSTASHGSQSGHLSINAPRGTLGKGFDSRKFSDHRISTVPEGDEDEPDHAEEAVGEDLFDNNKLLTAAQEIARGGSAPIVTSPTEQFVTPASLSNENTPKTGTDKIKKHKSSGSYGWIPKVSRWSETTASTVFRGFRSSGRNSGRKGEETSPPSRSGSDLGNYAESNRYGEDRLHFGFSQDQIDQYAENEHAKNLLPPEDPKYKAHCNSVNLQHPQPRPGPSHRYQSALESQAVDFDSPTSPKSPDWGSQTSLTRLHQRSGRYSPGCNRSPDSDGVYSNQSVSNQVAQRPVKDHSSPDRPPKIRAKLAKPSPLSNENLPDGSYERSGSPRSFAPNFSGSHGVAARKPTGPRNMGSPVSSGLNRDDGTTRRNKNRGKYGTAASNHSGESETF